MSIYELKIYLDLDPKSKSKILDRYAKKFYLGYFFVDSEDGHCYLFDRYGKEKDISLVYEINSNMIPRDIKKIVIPNNVVSIRDWTFENCSDLESVTIPNSMTSIDTYAFCECNKLTSMTISDSVISIGWGAMAGCSGLTDMTIGNSVMSIGYDAFHGCKNLKSLIFKNKTIDQVKAIDNYPFGIEDESIIKAYKYF